MPAPDKSTTETRDPSGAPDELREAAIGEIVHYVLHAGPNRGAVRPAMVFHLHPDGRTVDLFVFTRRSDEIDGIDPMVECLSVEEDRVTHAPGTFHERECISYGAEPTPEPTPEPAEKRDPRLALLEAHGLDETRLRALIEGIERATEKPTEKPADKVREKDAPAEKDASGQKTPT